MKKEFIISTESPIKRNDPFIGEFNIILKTEGMDFKRIRKNPVLLYNHETHIGKWENFRKENGIILGTPLFDNDDFSQVIKNKVEVTESLRAASISIDPLEIVVNDNGDYVVERSVIVEASIVDIPANEEALTISFSKKGENKLNKLIQLAMNKEIEVIADEIKPVEEEVIETVVEVAEDLFVEDEEKVELAKKLEEVTLVNSELELKLKETNDMINSLKDELQSYKNEKTNSLLDIAIETGKISQNNREQFFKLGFETAKGIIDNLPSGKRSLVEDFSNLTKNKTDHKDYEWYLKNDKEGLKKLSRENFSLYKKIESEYINKLNK